MDMDDDDLEMLRQAALKTIGTNRNRQKENKQASASNRTNNAPTTRIKTKGNLIEIQPAELSSDVAAREGLTSDDYIVEEFVLDGSEVSINSSDCDEVIEEVIVSDAEDANALNDDHKDEAANSQSQPSSVEGKRRSRSRSLSSPSNPQSSDDESDAVSIKSSYSLIMDDDAEPNNEFQSVEAKFLSRKLQKATENRSTPNEDSSTSSRRRRSRSPLPFRSQSRTKPRRSRSRDRDITTRNATSRKSRSKSRSPARRRNHSPIPSSSRGMRGSGRPYRASANSSDRNQRRRRSSRSPSRSPQTSNRKGCNQSNRRGGSRSRSPLTDNTKSNQRSASSSHQGASKSSPAEEKPERIEKTIKNNNMPKEEMERLEKRRKKFQGESDVLSSSKKVIKIASTSAGVKEKESPLSKSQSPEESTILKEKVQKDTSKRTVEIVRSSNDVGHHTEPEKPSSNQRSDGDDEKSSRSANNNGEEQEDLRTRLIKKKMQKMQQTSSGSSNGPQSTVVVVGLGSQRIFSQALKNSQLLDSSIEASSSRGTGSGSSSSKKRSKSPAASVSGKSSKPKSEVTVSRSDNGTSKRLRLGGSSSKSGASSSSSANKSKSSTSSSSTKRVVSVTYS